MFLLTEALSVLISRFNNIKDFEMHVYCKLQTARPHVWGFRLALLTSRGRFYASHLPQALLSWIFCCVQTLKSNTLAIFLQIGYNFLANEQLPSLLLLLLLLLFFFLERRWYLVEIQYGGGLSWCVLHVALLLDKVTHARKHTLPTFLAQSLRCPMHLQDDFYSLQFTLI